MKKTLILNLFVLFLLITFFNLSLENHESSSLEKASFIINKPYLTVVKSLSTKESLEKTINDNNGKLAYKQWEAFTVEVPKKILRLREYKVEGKLNFLVEKQDKDLGELRLPFEQNIFIDNQIFTINVKLSEPQKNVIFYNKIVNITPSSEDSLKTVVEIHSELKIKKRIPFFFANFMNKKVIENNKKDLDQLKYNLLNITESSSPIIKFK